MYLWHVRNVVSGSVWNFGSVLSWQLKGFEAITIIKDYYYYYY